jgi:hypothetical protein
MLLVLFFFISTYSLKVPEMYEKCLSVSSSVKGKSLPNIGGERMNPGIRILPLPSANGLPGGQMNE